MPKLLIVDDEPNLLYSLSKTLGSENLEILTAETGRDGFESVQFDQPDVVILDVRLPDLSGLDVFNLIHEHDPRLPVIIITAFSTTETAIEAMKRGAFDYLLKPVEFDKLRDVVRDALEISRMSHVPAMFADHEDIPHADLIVGHSSAMQHVYKAIGRVAPQDVTVLVLGESGTGKEMIARAIYHHSRRNTAPFQAINCAAIPESLLESELFGHERGAFSGADRQRIGKFEQLNGGTLFLDEIGDMSPATQAKVLRLLQDGSFERVGSNQTLQADVRIIAATNRDLESMVAQGTFRPDLYYRLRVFAIELPPLRERPKDLPLLVEHFVRVLGPPLNRQIRSVSPLAMEQLQNYTWPGNVRELQSAIKYALLHSVGETITPDCLPSSCHIKQARTASSECAEGDFQGIARFTQQLLAQDESEIYRIVHSEVDRVLLEHVLDHLEGNQVQAARVLGISRSTLRGRIEDLQLNLEKRISPDT